MLLRRLQVSEGETLETVRRGEHPHMNNLVYGRRSASSPVGQPVHNYLRQGSYAFIRVSQSVFFCLSVSVSRIAHRLDY